MRWRTHYWTLRVDNPFPPALSFPLTQCIILAHCIVPDRQSVRHSPFTAPFPAHHSSMQAAQFLTPPWSPPSAPFLTHWFSPASRLVPNPLPRYPPPAAVVVPIRCPFIFTAPLNTYRPPGSSPTTLFYAHHPVAAHRRAGEERGRGRRGGLMRQ